MSRGHAAAHYQVSPSSAIPLDQTPGGDELSGALPTGGKTPFTPADQEAWIRIRVDQKPDLMGRELLAELNQRDIEVSDYGV
jgi:hypothetical protein